MLLPDNIHPEATVYFNGAIVLRAVKHTRVQPVFGLFQAVQADSHNIRYKDDSVNNVLRTLYRYSRADEYETLYLFLLGCDFNRVRQRWDMMSHGLNSTDIMVIVSCPRTVSFNVRHGANFSGEVYRRGANFSFIDVKTGMPAEGFGGQMLMSSESNQGSLRIESWDRASFPSIDGASFASTSTKWIQHTSKLSIT